MLTFSAVELIAAFLSVHPWHDFEFSPSFATGSNCQYKGLDV